MKLQDFYLEDDLNIITFCEFLFMKFPEDLNFFDIIWIDESQFSIKSIFNIKNTHYWADENPYAVCKAYLQQILDLTFIIIIGTKYDINF